MTERRIVHTEHAPKAIGPYSQAVIANGFVFCAGQTGFDPATMEVVKGGISAETRQVLTNIKAVLEAAGSGLGKVVKTTVYLHDMGDFQAMNVVYAEFFPDAPPARTTVGNLNLPRGVLVEIEVIAMV
ncbi:MAG TPA: RidA family protein [Aggregatilineales bacterium]|nr:RidA family protein [Anaerolineales bacterium]HRE48838.1 RidA family protein [Aggregatilineales bacterium]